jgi:hypothetical protein
MKASQQLLGKVPFTKSNFCKQERMKYIPRVPISSHRKSQLYVFKDWDRTKYRQLICMIIRPLK